MRKPEVKRSLGKLVSYINRKIILNYVLKKQDRSSWTGFIWLWLGTSGVLLWTW